MNRVFTAYIA